MSYSIALLYSGLLALLLLALSFQVVRLRNKHKVGLGTGDHPALERAIRVHANFCEYVPIALVLLLVLELSTALSGMVLHGLGLMLLVGRILHAQGLSGSAGVSPGRFIGTLLTWMMIGISALLAAGMALGSLISQMGT